MQNEERRRIFTEGRKSVSFSGPMLLLEYMEVTVGALLEVHPAYAVMDLSDRAFVQVMANRDGSIRLESTASFSVIAANLGFTELVEQHDHIAAANLPAEWPAKEKMVAETVMRLVVDVHKIGFPAEFDVRMAVVDVEV